MHTSVGTPFDPELSDFEKKGCPRRDTPTELGHQFLKTSLVERNELVVTCTTLFRSFSGFTRASPVKQGFHS